CLGGEGVFADAVGCHAHRPVRWIAVEQWRRDSREKGDRETRRRPVPRRSVCARAVPCARRRNRRSHGVGTEGRTATLRRRCVSVDVQSAWEESSVFGPLAGDCDDAEPAGDDDNDASCGSVATRSRCDMGLEGFNSIVRALDRLTATQQKGVWEHSYIVIM